MNYNTADLINAVYGIRTTTLQNQLTNSVGTTPTKILKRNPCRTSILITNLGTTDIIVNNTPEVSLTRGIPVEAGGGSMVLQFDSDFHMVTDEYYAISSVLNSSILVFEQVIY